MRHPNAPSHINLEGARSYADTRSYHHHHSGSLSPRISRSSSPTARVALPSPKMTMAATMPMPADESMPPKTIILSLWPYARSEQIEYYVEGYRTLYPSAKLLLLPHVSSRRSAIAHIDRLLEEIIGENEEKQPLLLDYASAEPDTLLHLFGDDAASQACRLLRAYYLRTEQTMGIKALVLDSVPVIVAPTWRTLRTTPSRFFVFLYLGLLTLLGRLFSFFTCFSFSDSSPSSLMLGTSDTSKMSPQETGRSDINDPNVLPADTRRCYIFPEKDIMFAWDSCPSPAIEGDSNAAAATVQRHDFAVNRHLVGREPQRWSGDQERYWLGIENAWDGQ